MYVYEYLYIYIYIYIPMYFCFLHVCSLLYHIIFTNTILDDIVASKKRGPRGGPRLAPQGGVGCFLWRGQRRTGTRSGQKKPDLNSSHRQFSPFSDVSCFFLFFFCVFWKPLGKVSVSSWGYPQSSSIWMRCSRTKTSQLGVRRWNPRGTAGIFKRTDAGAASEELWTKKSWDWRSWVQTCPNGLGLWILGDHWYNWETYLEFVM